jgi:ribonuclease R
MVKNKRSQERTLKDNLEYNLFEFINGKNFTSSTIASIFDKLKIAPQHIDMALEIIEKLVNEKKIRLENDLVMKPQKEAKEVLSTTGTISMHPRGFGFVVSKDLNLYPLDIFIPKPFINGALEGDEVLCAITSQASIKGPEGAILEVLKRANKEVTGVIKQKMGQKEYKLFSPLYGAQKEVILYTPKVMKLPIGTRVVMTVEKWGSEKEPISGSLKEVLGDINEANLDVKAGVLEFHITHEFSPSCIQQAKDYGMKLTKKQLEGRKDLTKLETFTIDPTTAKDYDDALSLSKLDNRRYHLHVHIADVSHYVVKDTPLDDEAFKRGNSTYFPGKCVPMLPEELSNELCSLKENVKRLAVTVEMVINDKGRVDSYEIYRSVIKSQKRFTYLEAKEVLDGKKKSKHAPTLNLMVELCEVLKRYRQERGSIDLAMPAIDLLIDKDGIPLGLERVEYDVTHQMVEEFMLKANELVAYHLVKQGKPSVFRVHDKPEKENLEEFYTLSRALGFHLPHEPKIEDIKALFESAKTTPYAYQLSMNFIRSMKLAFYSDQNVGHYGLALEHYCHFTSPIRRYTDLVVHRQLFEDNIEQDLKVLSKHCSDTERKSFKAESSVVVLKKMRYLEMLLKEDPKKKYEATITKIKPFGFFFELDFLLFEGYMHVSELKDYYEFCQNRNVLVGKRNHEIIKHGLKIDVTILSIDLIERSVKFECLFKKSKSDKVQI